MKRIAQLETNLPKTKSCKSQLQRRKISREIHKRKTKLSILLGLKSKK